MKTDSTSDGGSGKKNTPTDSHQKAIQNLSQWLGIDCMALPRSHVLKLFDRVQRVHVEIEEAFSFQMFAPDLPADGPVNRNRSTAYLRAHMQRTELLRKAIELWLLTFGLSAGGSNNLPDQGDFSQSRQKQRLVERD
jgi:hypothetical protein